MSHKCSPGYILKQQMSLIDNRGKSFNKEEAGGGTQIPATQNKVPLDSDELDHLRKMKSLKNSVQQE